MSRTELEGRVPFAGVNIDRSDLGPILARGRTADIHAFGRDAVIKVLRPGFRSELIQIEADKTRAVAGAGVPVPRVMDVTVVADRPALIVERIDGDSMLSRLLNRPQQLVPLARLQADLHADLATVRVTGLPSLATRLAERIDKVSVLPAVSKQGVLRALFGLADADALCHGDFHPENIILGARGAVIIDWLDATCGPPAADVARSDLLLSLADPPQQHNLPRRALLAMARTFFRRIYLARYRRRAGLDAEALAAWMPIIAAGRLAEGVDDEPARLIAMIEKGFALPGPPAPRAANVKS